MTDLDIIILAAGKGTRMGGDKAKVLTPLAGKPMISHLIQSVEKAYGVKPVIVVGFQADTVKEACGPDYRYAHQEVQRGTGHAVREALVHVRPDAQQVIVLYGDHPLVSADMIQSLHTAHVSKKSPITLATAQVGDFNEWRKTFYEFGRIIRDLKGDIVKITEKKDANEIELAVTEINPAYFCFDAEWLRHHINTLDTKNAQGEYYLTDLISIAQKEGHILNSISIPPHEALGANTPEQLNFLLNFVK
jgi:bifunctional UDP-N-acetylglucosamine pyrophosphorylase/glucosamine-1-phosphate N-acetyltransferase